VRVGLLAALAVAVLLLGGLAPARQASADGGAVVGVTDLNAGPEEPGKVTLWADGLTEPGLSAWTVDIYYNHEALNVVECAAEHGGICNPAFGEKGHVIRIAGTSVEGITGETALASITFACKKVGDSHIELKVDTFADATVGGPQPIATKAEDGKALCKEEEPKLPGDVDCDEDVDTIDAVLVLQLAAGLIDGLECPKNADLNGDEKIDSLDAAVILQIVAGLVD
jgi:hypothetical protein